MLFAAPAPVRLRLEDAAVIHLAAVDVEGDDRAVVWLRRTWYSSGGMSAPAEPARGAQALDLGEAAERRPLLFESS